ncbi:ABC transporter permease [Nonomuraea bangladeshensis]|uniref:ABC transporter permease n=1 Tax=Nonomuraea bangladeshensis TaxID=404385 RepID=UPI0031E27BFC
MAITTFIVKRLAGGLGLLAVLSLLVFGLLAISPGTPIQTLLGTRPASPELVAALNAKYHLDEPFIVQYGHWLTGLLGLDLGESISVQTGSGVAALISERISLSLQLGLYALLLVALVGIPLGMAAGIRRGHAVDRVVSLLSTVAVGAPSFVLSIVLLYVFGAQLGWFPIYGIGSGVADRITHLTLPAIALATVLSAIVIRQTRASMLTVMRQDYITFARLRGLSPARVLLRYALRNSSLPVITSTGLIMIATLSSAVFVEQVFSIPGAGSLLLAAVTNKDVPVVQGMAMLLGLFVIVINLVVDLISLALDPRIRFTVKEA